jgi:hypothetical protein
MIPEMRAAVVMARIIALPDEFRQDAATAVRHETLCRFPRLSFVHAPPPKFKTRSLDQ